MSNAVEIARFDGWQLLVMPWPNYTRNTPWWPIYLLKEEGKGRFYLTWNGSRFSNGTETKRAAKMAPGALKKAAEVLQHAIPH